MNLWGNDKKHAPRQEGGSIEMPNSLKPGVIHNPRGIVIESFHIVRDEFDWRKTVEANGVLPTYFHGTSTLLLPSILTNGLDPTLAPVNEKMWQELERVFTALGNQGHLKEQEIQISITFDLRQARTYAYRGPKQIERALKFIDTLILNNPNLKPEDEKIVVGIRSQLISFLQHHRPILIGMNSAAPVISDESRIFDTLYYDPRTLEEANQIASGSEDDDWYHSRYSRTYQGKLAHLMDEHPDESPPDYLQRLVRLEDTQLYAERFRADDILYVEVLEPE